MRINNVSAALFGGMIAYVCAEQSDFGPAYMKSLPFIDTNNIKTSGFCWEISSQSNAIFDYYRKKGDDDSLALFLRFLSARCPEFFQQSNLNIIRQIQSGSFHEDSLPSTFFLEYIRDYGRSFVFDLPKRQDGYLQYLVDSLSKTLHSNSIEYLLTILFKGNRDEFFQRLRFDTTFSHTRIKRLFDQEYYFALKTMDNRTLGYVALTFASGNSSCGTFQPDLGILWGKRINRFFGDFHISVGFGGYGAHPLVLCDNACREMKPEMRLSFGIDIGYDLFINDAHHIDFIIGLSINQQWFKAVAENDSTSRIKTSLSPCPGIGYRFYVFKRRLLISPQIRCWRVKYRDIRYNAVGLRVLIGPSDRLYEDGMLEALGIAPK